MLNTKNKNPRRPVFLLAALLGMAGGIQGMALPQNETAGTSALDVTTTCDADEPQQGPHRRRKGNFDPDEYFRKMEEYITAQAGLTAAEAKAFFPVFRETKRRQRELSHKIGKQMKRLSHEQLSDAACDQILAEVQNLHLQEAQLQNSSLREWRKILSARKVLKVLKAEGEFGRKTFREMTKEQ